MARAPHALVCHTRAAAGEQHAVCAEPCGRGALAQVCAVRAEAGGRRHAHRAGAGAGGARAHRHCGQVPQRTGHCHAVGSARRCRPGRSISCSHQIRVKSTTKHSHLHIFAWSTR